MDAPTWDRLVASFPAPHLLQTWEWAQVKARAGWEPLYLLWDESQQLFVNEEPPVDPSKLPAAVSLVLQRTLSITGVSSRLRVLYAPKGPLLRDWTDARLRNKVLQDLAVLAHRQKAIFIKIDPDVPLGAGISGEPGSTIEPTGEQAVGELQSAGWRFSPEQVQFRNTILVDLVASESELLARMKPKTRYNIRLAARKGVSCRPGGLADLELLYSMYAETSVRDGFVIRERDYYLALWRAFMEKRPVDSSAPSESSKLAGEASLPVAEPLIAEVEGQPVAALVAFRFGRRAWYLHGMSRAMQRELMPNHLLQWEAMRRAKAAGCTVYDLWGAPDVFAESDPLWGVYRFKEGFGGVTLRTIGAWDLPVRLAAYRLYTQVLPRLLEIMRNRGRKRTRQTVLAA